MSNRDEKELQEFMESTTFKDNKDSKKLKKDEMEEGLPEYKDPIKQTEGSGSQIDESAVEAMKFMINFFIIYPLMIVLLIGGGIMAIKFMPYLVVLARRILVALSQAF